MELPLREDLAGHEPYGAPQLDVPVRLNVNENPFPPPPEVVGEIVQATAAAAARLNRYPDRDFAALRADLAAYLARESDATFLSPDQLWAANGSNEVMLHFFQAFGGPGRTALSFDPTYSMYPEYARDTHTTWVTATRGPDFAIDPELAVAEVRRVRPSLVVLASPNNPTGTAVAPQVITALCEATADAGRASAIVVVDEAYAEFRRPGTPSSLALLPRYPHLAVSRTMSKAFALAGARVGYLAADSQLIAALRTVRLPYHLSAVTQGVARAALAHADALLAQVDLLRRERDDLVAYLRTLRFDTGPAEVPESHANFVLFGRFGDRGRVWQGLLERGVLIRQTGPQGYLRVSVGTPDENAAFRAALTEVI